MTPEGVFFCWWGGAERDFVNSAKLARSGNSGVTEKGGQLGGRQFQGTDSLNDHAVFFLLTLFLQVFDLGLPLGSLLPGLFQLPVNLFKFAHFVLLSQNQFKRPKA